MSQSDSKPQVIIPARLGSKRVPKKNIRLLEGEPIVGHTIRILQEMDLFSRISISTESEEVAEISRKYGAEANYLRPAELANDSVPTLSVVQDFLSRDSRSVDSTPVFCIYPFAVFLTKEIIINALTRLEHATASSESSFVVPFKEFSHPIQRAFRMNPNDRMLPRSNYDLNQRTQDLEKTFFDAGQFYLANKKTWLDADSMFSHVYGLILEMPTIIDIDTEKDWMLLQFFWQSRKSL